MANIRDHKKLLGFCSTIHGLCARYQRLLDKFGQTLTFDISGLYRRVLQKREPGNEQRGDRHLALRVISLCSSRRILVSFVEMNADEDAILRPIGQRSAISQRNIVVAIPSQERSGALRLQ